MGGCALVVARAPLRGTFLTRIHPPGSYARWRSLR